MTEQIILDAIRTVITNETVIGAITNEELGQILSDITRRTSYKLRSGIGINIDYTDPDSPLVTCTVVQQSSDWNALAGPTFIKNKPIIPSAQINSDWNAIDGLGKIINKPNIPVVPANVSAFTNDARYLTTETQLQSDWNATIGARSIANKPVVAVKVSELLNDSNYITGANYYNKQEVDSKVSAADKNYVVNVSAPSIVWVVEHTLNKYPAVTITDLEGTVMEATVNYIDNNNLTVTFNNPFSGTLILN